MTSTVRQPSPGAHVTDALVERIRSLPLAQRRQLVERIRGQGVADLYPPSYAQEQLWFLDRLRPGDSFYNIPVALELTGPLEPQRLARALAEVVRRHEALRTTFLEIDGEPFQRVGPPSPGAAALPLVDLSGLPVEGRSAVAESLAEGESGRPFDLARGPLLRCRLLRLGCPSAPRWGLLLTVHHIVADGWSMGVLVAELGALYEGRSLPPLPRQYADFALWQRQRLDAGELERQVEWWRQELDQLPPLPLRGDRPPPPVSSGAGHRVTLTLDTGAAAALGHHARAAGASEFMVLLAAFGALLARWTGAPELAVGTAAAQRQRAELESLVGYFVNSLTLRLPVLAAGFGANAAAATSQGDGATGSEPSDGPTFEALVDRAKAVAIAAFDHQEVPFDQVVKAVAPRRQADRNPLFQAMLTVQNLSLRNPRLGSAEVRPLPGIRERRKFNLHADWWPGGESGTEGAWALTLQADADLFDRTTVERLGRAYGRLLAAALENPEIPVAALPLLSAAETHAVTVEFSGVGNVAPTELSGLSGLSAPETLVSIFRRRAAETPDAPAVTRGAETLTYGELHRRARSLATALEHALALRGTSPRDEATVAVALGPSPSAVVAILGVLEAGCAYVPLDPTYPARRLRHLLDIARPAAVVVEGAEPPPAVAEALAASLTTSLGESLWSVGPPPVVSVNGPAPVVGEPAPRRAPAGPDALAYVLFTSGSTGRPKGVAVPHRAVLRLVRDQQGAGSFLPFSRDRVFLLAAPLAFDASTLEIWGPLLHGARLEVMPAGRFTPGELLAVARAAGVTTLWLTAALFQRLVEEKGDELASLPALREVLTGGDVVPPGPVARMLEVAPQLRLVNGYGPTENTTFTCCRWLRRADLERPSLPVGEPIGGTSAWVLDARLRPTPPAVAGQLWAGGEGLARGYHGNPRATAAAFRPHPLSPRPGQRLYATGDEARWGSDGAVEFFGRRDRQIKLRGHRIELGEVEAALADHPAVAAAAVVVRHDPEARLVAYAVCSSAEAAEPHEVAMDGRQLRQDLARRLPAPMVPALVMVLDELPLTARGKVDRRRLPAPPGPSEAPAAASADASTGDPTAEGAFEARVAALWRELLRVPDIARDDDFFAVGGHSLMVTQLLSRLQETFAVEIPLRTLFDHPTVAGQGAWLRERLAGSPEAAAVPEATARRGSAATPLAGDGPIPLVPRDPPPPLSYAQERLWFLQHLQPRAIAYNEPMALEVKGELSVPALESAFSRVVERHETLRTRFPRRDGVPVQTVEPAMPVRLPVVDVAGLAPSTARREGERLAAAQAAVPFDLAADPLLRLALLRLTPRHHRLTATLHHLVVDGWSLGILRHELSLAYAAAVSEPSAASAPSADLPPLPVQYADFAAWQRRVLDDGALETLLAYWRRRLEGAQRLELATDRPRPALESYRGERLHRTLSPEATAALRHLATTTGVTLFPLLLSAFGEVVGRWSGRRDLLLGTLLAGRRRREVEDLVGFFVGTLALRLDRGAATTPLAAHLATVRDAVLEDFDRQDLPFERLVEELAPRRDLSRHPLFGICFQLVENRGPALELPGLEVVGQAAAVHSAKWDLQLAWVDTGDALTAVLELNRELYDPTTGARLLDQVLRWLSAAAARPEAAVGELPSLSAGQRHQLVVEWPLAPAVPVPLESTQERLDGLVAAQMRRTPEAPALLWDGGCWTYGELSRAAGALALRLRYELAELDELAAPLPSEPAVEPTVALYLERGPTLVAAVLATLASGAAYVALDPAYPAERLAAMAQDAAPAVVITSPALEGQLARSLAVGDATHSDESDGSGISIGAARRLVVDEAQLLEMVSSGESTDGLPPASVLDALPPVATDPRHPAYLIYTSGSTGRPKGVTIPHRAAAALVRWAGAAFPPAWRQRVFAGTSLCFDLSIFELFLPLAHGGAVVLGRDALALDGHPASGEVTMVNTVPSSMAELLRRGAVPPSVRAVCLAGEPLPRDLVASAEALPGVEAVFNLYGPSEDTTYSTWERVTAAVDHEPLVGRSVGGKKAWVVDEAGEPVPPGVTGELWLGGMGLARGYRQRPAATATAFRPQGFGGRSGRTFHVSGERLYRTGDLASWTADGRLRFLGRRDHQVKVRGFRIEPGEVEARLRGHDAVEESLVAAVGEGPDRRLVAWVGRGAGAAVTPEPDELRAFVATALPAFMVPAELLVLDALPRLPNGKVDRAALPSPTAARRGAGGRPPEGELERQVAAAVAAVLGTDPGREENFFDLGAHSLRMVQVQERLESELGRPVPVLEMFRHPSVKALAAFLESGSAGTAEATESFAEVSDRGEALSRGRNRLAQRRQLGRGRGSGRKGDQG